MWKLNPVLLICCSLTSCILCGCEGASNISLSSKEQKIKQKTLNTTSEPGALLGSYHFSWPQLTNNEALAKASKLAKTIFNQNLSTDGSSFEDKKWFSPFKENTKISFYYNKKYNDFRLKDMGLLGTNKKPVTDVGEKEAKVQMANLVNKLISDGIINDGQFDLNSVTTGHHKVKIGIKGQGVTDQWVAEYRFRMMRKLNGIEVANAGLHIGVHPSGKISSTRFGGVEIESIYGDSEELPGSNGKIIKRQVSDGDIEIRVNKEIIQGSSKFVKWKRLMYVMPNNLQDGAIEPKMVYKYAGKHKLANGDNYFSDVKYVALSLTDSKALPEDLNAERYPSTTSDVK